MLLYKKELLEFVRDRRTFLIMLLVPALLYPGLIIVTSELAAKQIATQSKKTYIIGVKKSFESDPLIKRIGEEENFTIKPVEKADFERVHVYIEPEVGYSEAVTGAMSGAVKISYRIIRQIGKSC